MDIYRIFLANSCRFLAAAWLLAGTALHAQHLYKSVDPDGRVVYSDRPPAEGRIEKTVKLEAPPASALGARSSSYVEQLRRLRASVAQLPPAPVDTVLFSAKWCGYCRLAKSYLGAKGIPFREVDIDTPAGLAVFAAAGGGPSIPLFVRGDTRIQGFSEGAYAALAKAPSPARPR